VSTEAAVLVEHGAILREAFRIVPLPTLLICHAFTMPP